MAFDVNIRFTGICTLVRDSAHPKATVVLPHAWDKKPIYSGRPSVDYKRLRRHRAFLQFPTNQLLGCASAPPEAQSILYLNGKLGAADLPGADVRLVTTGSVTPNDVQTGDLAGLADLTTIAPDFSAVDSRFLQPQLVPGMVASRVLLDKGELSAPDGPREWVFPPTLSGATTHVNLASELVVSMQHVESLRLGIYWYDGSTPTVLPFEVASGTVELTVAHLCDENQLRWQTEMDYTNQPPDQDFRWHFELLDSSTRGLLRQQLAHSIPLPLPYSPYSLSNGQGVDCFPANSQSQPTP